MASELTLEINGRKRDILRYNYRFHREIRYNRPVDSIWGGEICVEMTSDGDTYFLEMLMAEKEVIKEINGTRKTFTVSAAVSGKIQFIKENEIFRELSFQEAYVVFYGERMSSIGPKSMSTFLVISPMKMEVNKRVMMVKRQDTGINLGWVQKVEEKPKPTPVTPYTPPILLVRTVNGETEALPNEIIEYKVTSYNLPNVSNSDRKRVKWDIEIDGKRETLNVKGETINLTIKEEWVNKEITVMPYLKTPDENVSVKTKINERLLLMFNGSLLIFRVVEKNQILRFSYKAVSGRPLEDGSFEYSKQRQKMEKIGPIPEGEYYINPQEIQYADDRTMIDKVAGLVGVVVNRGGTMPGGKFAWGIGRVWIHPQSVIIDGVLRTNFSIHGGTDAGSAGCIDLTSNDKPFFDTLEKYKGDCTKIKLIVDYSNK